ncbi:MAG: PfkB family carbohydrate kinase [Methylacidiphilales bacterium]|nr:PfkB family carbohydrate kinase [Candidatus Methylacidiphilales bacterium]MDW8349625.1 PfkB family carbohydrate kinase [Verrucomicrobiae bacterium]
MKPVLIVGSIGLDDIRVPEWPERKNLLGGSASYAALATSLTAPVRLVGVVGSDFPDEHVKLYLRRNVCLKGLQRVEGKTFRWAGEYEEDMNNRRTLSVELNVFADFSPELPEGYHETEYVLLANIAPTLQHRVLDQVQNPRFVVADTMDLWIHTAREDLMQLLPRINMLVLNDSEARALTGEKNLVKAARWILREGAEAVVIKKGEHGSLLMSGGEMLVMPAMPLEEVLDPTGAGDTFVGGLIGYLAIHPNHDFEVLREAVIHGTVLASFNVEAFGPERLANLTKDELEARRRFFKRAAGLI